MDHNNKHAAPGPTPRSVLICHHDSELNREAVARWLGSFTDLVGIVVIRESPWFFLRRMRHEIRRIGWLRMFDVLAMRIFYRLALAKSDRRAREEHLKKVYARFPSPVQTEVLETASPNSPDAEAFMRRLSPNIMVARCKRILTRRVFTIPTHGTWVLHPGVCPEYRNAHGCFWALARRDLERVGLTLLKIDEGVDTGPVHGYFTYPYDESAESHIIIMERMVLENLDRLREAFEAVLRGESVPIDTTGRDSGVWGQPWLSSYLNWKREASRATKPSPGRAG